MENLIGKELNPLKFQKEVIKKIVNKNALVSMPTNSGKTLVAYSWANVLQQDFKKIIFTAPIKALSNERYRELKKENLDVGLITGDVKWNPKAQILCMTQEIYYQHYYKYPAHVIIDEFHYIFHNSDRARCYIESIKNSNYKSNFLLMSATCSNPSEIKNYLEYLTNKKFTLAESNSRLVPLTVNKKGIKLKDVKDSIVFCFSKKNIYDVIKALCAYRKLSSKHLIKEIYNLCYEYNVLPCPEWEIGVAAYHGKILPKEKMMIEYLYRKGYIDTVVATDSLALGVNLPAKYVVMAQLKKNGVYLKPSEFKQLTGRAGRFGQHEEGVATWLRDNPIHDNSYDFKKEFIRLSEEKLEDVKITLEYDPKKLLQGAFAEEEAEFCSSFSFPVNGYKEKYKDYHEQILEVEGYIRRYFESLEKEYGSLHFYSWRNFLINVYLSEWDLEKNFYMSEIVYNNITKTGKVDVVDIFNIASNNYVLDDSPGSLYELLLLNKWVNNILELEMPVAIINSNYIKDLINNIDHTIFRPDLTIG